MNTASSIKVSFSNVSSNTKSSLENSQNLNKNESPSSGKNFVFDLTSTDFTDLASDLHEFNNFYQNGSQQQYSQIERPQNPFYKNFQSFKGSHINSPSPQQRHSYNSEAILEHLDSDKFTMKKQPSEQNMAPNKRNQLISNQIDFSKLIKRDYFEPESHILFADEN